MRIFFVNSRILGGAALLALSCAGSAFADGRVPSMPLGAYASPPTGFAAFCARQPLECGVGAGEPLLADVSNAVQSSDSSWAQAFQRARADRALVTGSLSAVRSPATFVGFKSKKGRQSIRAPLMESTVPVDGGAGAAAPLARQPYASLKLLQKINRDINLAIRPATDEAIFGVLDRWSEPLSDGTASGAEVYGDCEDYVLEKRRALIAAGIDQRALSIAVVRTQAGTTHAVLLVATEKGEYVLDNLSYWVMPWADAPYVWISRQVDGDARDWRSVVRGGDGSRTTQHAELRRRWRE